MGLRASFATALLCALLLPGCTAVGLARLEPGRSTEVDVRQALGEPARSFANPDGTRQLVVPNIKASDTMGGFLAKRIKGHYRYSKV